MAFLSGFCFLDGDILLPGLFAGYTGLRFSVFLSITVPADDPGWSNSSEMDRGTFQQSRKKEGSGLIRPSFQCYPYPGQSHLKLNYNVQYGNKNYHAAKRKGGDRNRIKANEVKDNEEGKRALVGQTDRTGRR